jgi:putative membrane protein
MQQLWDLGVTLLWPPEINLMLAVAAAGYFVLFGRRRKGWGPAATRRQMLSFMGALLLAWIGLGTPIHIAGEVFLFTAHQITTTLLTLLIPPLVIWGIPTWAYERALDRPAVRAVARLLTRPLVAFLMFNLVPVIWHLPPLFDAAIRSDFLHGVQYATLFLSGFVGWWPLISPVQSLPPISDPMQLGYTFLCIVRETILLGWIMIVQEPIYEVYRHAPRLFHNFSALDDQQLSHMFMGVLSPIVLGAIFIKAFMRILNQEEQARPLIKS